MHALSARISPDSRPSSGVIMPSETGVIVPSENGVLVPGVESPVRAPRSSASDPVAERLGLWCCGGVSAAKRDLRDRKCCDTCARGDGARDRVWVSSEPG